ncbi:hypothetical protein GGS24DRAFT_512556 [Hypoxylon argillaceum]|nr:hypothetical protein GGS24DRAFT_512556 [Hypoxylon argillaceum]
MWSSFFNSLLSLLALQSPLMFDTMLERQFDVLTATVGGLRYLLESGKQDSVDLVQAYLDQITKHNHDGLRLHAITATAPAEKLLEEAKALDIERKTSGPRSPLHGIPITIKVMQAL